MPSELTPWAATNGRRAITLMRARVNGIEKMSLIEYDLGVR